PVQGRIRIGERTTHDRVAAAEQQAVGPRPEREREHRHNREAGAPAELAERVAEVTHTATPPSDRPARRGEPGSSWPRARPRGARVPLPRNSAGPWHARHTGGSPGRA